MSSRGTTGRLVVTLQNLGILRLGIRKLVILKRIPANVNSAAFILILIRIQYQTLHDKERQCLWKYSLYIKPSFTAQSALLFLVFMMIILLIRSFFRIRCFCSLTLVLAYTIIPHKKPTGLPLYELLKSQKGPPCRVQLSTEHKRTKEYFM